MLVDQELANIEQGFVALDHQLEIMNLCSKALDAYSEDVEKPQRGVILINGMPMDAWTSSGWGR